MNANLHIHSRFSDGSLWPEEIARIAAALGLSAVAVTDHDSMGGTERFVRACREQGILAVPACEIDVNEPRIDYKSEILAYFPDTPSPGPIQTRKLLSKVLVERLKRIEYYLYWARTVFRRNDLNFEDLLRGRLKDADIRDQETVAQLS